MVDKLRVNDVKKITKVLTTSVSKNADTALETVSELTIPMKGGVVYGISGVLLLLSGTTPDIKIVLQDDDSNEGLYLPASSSGPRILFGTQQVLAMSGQTNLVQLMGEAHPTNDCNLIFRFAQNVSHASDTWVTEGTWIEARWQ